MGIQTSASVTFTGTVEEITRLIELERSSSEIPTRKQTREDFLQFLQEMHNAGVNFVPTNKITLIKFIRNRLNLNLVEAKNWVESRFYFNS